MIQKPYSDSRANLIQLVNVAPLNHSLDAHVQPPTNHLYAAKSSISRLSVICSALMTMMIHHIRQDSANLIQLENVALLFHLLDTHVQLLTIRLRESPL